MTLFKRIVVVSILSFVSVMPVQAESINIDELLELVKKGQARDNQSFNARLSEFTKNKNTQQEALTNAKHERASLERSAANKESQFAENELTVSKAQERLNNRLGSLKELFGVLQQVAGDAQSTFSGSLISSELTGREAFLSDLIKKAGSSSKLPSIEELEQLWFEVQREMTYSGRVAKYSADVVLPGGETVTKEVIRIGSFNAISDDKYLNYDFQSKKLIELPHQPSSRYTSTAADFAAANSGSPAFWLDPSRGQLLTIMGQTATFKERINQGGAVGYIILTLAVIGIVLAIFKMIVIAGERNRIKAQMYSIEASDKNALGRVMLVYKKHEQADVETLELHLAEAISSEVPKLSSGIGWIKIISVVAPLLGLLGTVTGMIDVFETMSLFGTGDPKLMAGGISQALITTVLGLIAAIPCVFLHTLVNNRSRALIMILQERATGILARKSEQAAAA